MNLERFQPFQKICTEHLAGTVGEVLKQGQGRTPLAVGFITTDDFYGFYLTWDHTCEIYECCEWKQAAYPDFLYQPLVDIVDACKDIDLCDPSEEKWAFAKGLLTVLEGCIKQLPEKIFQENGYKREDILFFAAMSDGDYVQELTDESVTMFNRPETVRAYGIKVKRNEAAEK